MTRPAHNPIAARCDACGAPIQIQDEKARLVICGSCGTRHELTGVLRDSLQVVGDKQGRDVQFRLKVGDSFRWKGARYEVTARLCWIEDGSMKYATRVYVLYHPRRPLLYLDEYQGVWGISGKSHVMPYGNWQHAQPGGRVKTHDGKSWRLAEKCRRQLVYVDGCLPWMTEVGEVVVAWEFIGAGGETYEVEKTSRGREVEFNRGRVLKTGDLVRAGLKQVKAKKPGPPQFIRKRQAGLLVAVGVFGIVSHLFLAAGSLAFGETVLNQTFGPQQLTQEITSKPFKITKKGLTRVKLDAPLDNAWMAVDVALVKGKDEVVHVTDADISYYHGYEGGESWSEGSKSESILLSGATPGTYRLHLRAISNLGDTESANRSQHKLQVRVVQGAKDGMFAIFGCFVGGFLLLVGVLWFKVIAEE